MVRGAKLVRLVEAGRIELRVVVEDERLIGVDVPDRRAGDVVDEIGARECMVELTREAVEDEAVPVGVVNGLLREPV